MYSLVWFSCYKRRSSYVDLVNRVILYLIHSVASMVHFTRIFIALALTVGCLSCSSWALSVPATTSSTTCSSQLRELATQMDDAFRRVFDDITETADSIFSLTVTPPTGGTSTCSNPTSIKHLTYSWCICCHTWTLYSQCKLYWSDKETCSYLSVAMLYRYSATRRL